MGYVENRLLDFGVFTRSGSKWQKVKYDPATTEKPCTKCKAVKPLDQYSPLAKGALGRNPVCIECRRRIAKDHTRRVREKRAGRLRPESCDCCGAAKTLRRAMHWDHDHATGSFRGWVCHHCNLGLGAVQDSEAHLQQLIDYLKRGGGPTKC